jgi:molecular chaperone GrpE
MENSETVETPVPAETEPDLAAERDGLAAEKDELYERLLRAKAEFENYRRRVERERSELLEYAGAEAVREILRSWTISSAPSRWILPMRSIRRACS